MVIMLSSRSTRSRNTAVFFVLSSIFIFFALFFSQTLFIRPQIKPSVPSFTQKIDPLKPLPSSSIPTSIWQIYFDSANIPTATRQKIETWKTFNPTYTHHLLDKKTAEPYIIGPFASQPTIISLFHELRSKVLLSDLLRYLLLLAHGGTYSDTDTEIVHPIDTWVPLDMRNSTKVVISIEYDRGNDAERAWGEYYDLQFCQWTLMSAPGHPLLKAAVDDVVKRLEKLKVHSGLKSFADIQLTDEGVLKTTGPAMWTQLVMKAISTQEGREVGWRELSGLKEPRKFGDILILPGYAFNQWREGDTLVNHAFDGSWRTPSGWRSWLPWMG